MYRSIPKPPMPPGQTPGHLAFLKNFGQIPCYVASFDVKCPTRYSFKSARAMTREGGSPAESKNCEILVFPTAGRRFGTKVKCPTGRASCYLKFPTVQSLTRVKCPGIARGGGWVVLELTGTLLLRLLLSFCFDWEVISNTRDSVSLIIQTPRISSKILRCASYFQLSSRCLDIPMKHCRSCLISYIW